MKKLLFQLDTGPYPSVFDTVVAYDGGADHVIGFANCKPNMVSPLVEGAIFTRAEIEKKNTALFIGGSDINLGESILDSVRNVFFGKFQVSVMLDSNGCNTTASAAVVSMLSSGSLSGKKAVILAGTGPVGTRVAIMMAKEGAQVTITSRSHERSASVSKHIKDKFGVVVQPYEAKNNEDRAELIENANIVFATGAAGVQLLAPENWQNNPNIEIIADANTVPPLGIGGVEMSDKGYERHGKIIWGALGFGGLKLTLQRQCVAKLFDSNDQVLNVDEIFKIAKGMK